MAFLSAPVPAMDEERPVNATGAAAFCSSDQAFGIGFGSREVPGMHLSVFSSLVELGPTFAPFGTAEVAVTMKSRRRHTVHAQADFESEREAREALAAIGMALLDAGWNAEPTAPGKPQSFFSDPEARHARRPKGRIAELFTLGSRLYFSCSDAGWKRKAERELPQRPGVTR